jgi:uncharacterized protein YigA (DUF484 family)
MLSLGAERDFARGRRAAARVRASGGSAVAAACAHIEAAFAPPMRHSMFKDRIAALMAGGAGHAEARARYRGLAEQYPAATLDGAIATVERLRREELEARAAAIRIWGHCSRPQLALMMLDELRLILRVVRRHAPSRFSELVAITTATELSFPPSSRRMKRANPPPPAAE